MKQTHTQNDMPAASAAALQRLVDRELSQGARLGYMALLLISLTMTLVVATLLATEPDLPAATQLAFGLLVGIGFSWVVFASWTLTHRRILMAGHRVVAGRMAVIFSSLFVVASLVLGYTTGRASAFNAALVGALQLTAAMFLLIRAHRSFAELQARRANIELELKKEGR